MATARFERSVFINCPFDSDYAPLLQAMLFTVIDLGLHPRIATESIDSGALRLEKIWLLIENSMLSIHDLSRAQATAPGEFYRLNMPFELGLDYGCRQFGGRGRARKRILILEERPYRYQASLSDLAGCDIQVHGADYQIIMRKVRNWLASEARLAPVGANRIILRYADFQAWHFDRQLERGFSEDDIRDYPTVELMDAMRDWVRLGRPMAKA